MPDLGGESPEVILDAVFSAMAAAHPEWQAGPDEPVAGRNADACSSCVETFRAGERLTDPTGQAWVSPLLRLFNTEMAWLDEMKRWSDRPGVRFDRGAWDADQERQEREHYFTNHYRGVIPPWVLLGGDDSGHA